jgi:hypothetical protein
MNNTIELLTKFVNQRPGLDFANYGDSKSYNSESREITKDRNDYFELLSLAFIRLGSDFETKLKFNLENSSGRLTLKNGSLDYCTGQYFPTEYRPAANRILSQLIFNNYRDEQEQNAPNPLYKNGNEIRKAIKRAVSQRVYKNYFN